MNRKNIPVITEDIKKKAIEFIDNLEKILDEFMETLTADERLHMRKMGDGSVEYVHKCFRAAEASKAHFPANFDFDAFKKVTTFFDQMQPIKVRFQMVGEKLDDTMMFIRSVMISMADDAYSILKRASKHDGAVKTLVDDIGTHYKGRGPKKKMPKK
jgi:hypothetical protein